MRWFIDEIAKAAVARQGIRCRVATISIADIDMKLSRQNRAREVALTAPIVDNYAAAMLRDEAFPSIVVVTRGTKYVIAGGNHRVSAAIKNKETECLAIVCDNCDEHDFDILCRSLNSRLGNSASAEELVRQAADLVNDRAVPIKEAAESLNVSVEQIRFELAANSVAQIGIDCGVNPKWSRAAFVELSRVKLKSVIEHAMKTCWQLKPTSDQVRKLKTAIAACGTEVSQKAAVDKWKSEISANKSKRSMRRPHKMSICRAITELKGVMNLCKTVEQTQMSREELAAAEADLREIVASIAKMMSVG